MKRLLTLIFLLLPLGLAAEDIVLQNDRAKLVFDGGREFALKSFVMEGVEIAASGTTHPWEIEVLGPRGESAVIKPWNAVYDGGTLHDNTAQFNWRLRLEGSTDYFVLMTVTLEPDMDLPHFGIDAILPKGWTVTMAEFPRIALRRPADPAKVIMPAGYGIRYDAPAGGWLHGDYPSCTAAMQLTMATSPEGTLFFSTLDDGASQKQFFVGAEGDALIFLQKTVASADWTDELGFFQLPWLTVAGFTRESWEQTVLKWYRPWALGTKWGHKNLAERRVCPWILGSDIWLTPHGASSETMTALRSAIEYFGKGVGLHWYQWHHNAFDTDYPDYFPAKDGFAEMVAEAQGLGARVTPYINARLWDTHNHTFAELGGAQAACRRRDGTLYTEIYGSNVINTVCCPSTPEWRKVIRDLNARLLDSLGVDGVYMDQIGAAKGEPCYADGHPHPKGGGQWWHHAYREMLQGMRSELFTGDRAMTTEENGECYIDLFDMMLIVNTPHGPSVEMVPLFPLVYSDRCVYSGFSYITPVINDGSLDHMTAKSLLWGSQLGWVSPNAIMASDNAAQAAFLLDLAAFRRSAHDIFEGGRFLGEFVPEGDNPACDIPGFGTSPMVLGARWLTLKGREVYLLVNMDKTDHKVTLPGGRSVLVKARSVRRQWK